MSQSPTDRSRKMEAAGSTGPALATDQLAMWTPMLGGLGDWYQTVTRATIALNTEWLRFGQHRLKEDTALIQHLSSCKSPDEFWQVYAQFWRTAADDYQKELTELARLGSGVASEVASSRQHTWNGRDVEEPTRPARH